MTSAPTVLATGDTLVSDLNSLCVFDLETSGIDVFNDRIVTAYLGRIGRDGVIRGSYNWLVNPGVDIAESAAAIHGISNEVAREQGQDAAEAIGEILDVLRRSIASGRPTVAYNASFDLSMLNAEAIRYGHEPLEFPVVLDPYVIDKGIDRYRKGKRKLIVTAAYYGVPLSEEAAHDAEADAVATGRVAWAVLNALPAYEQKHGHPPFTLDELHSQQILWARQQAAGLEEYFRRSVNPDAVVDGSWPIRISE